MDQLTGLPTHQDLARHLASNFHPVPVGSAILFDIDGFSHLNYHRGHREGDAVLAHLGQWLGRRGHELGGQTFRVAGEEFLLILPNQGVAAALSQAQAVLAECAALQIPYERASDSRTFVALSAVAFPLPADLPERLTQIRDQAAARLYELELAQGRDYGIVDRLEVS